MEVNALVRSFSTKVGKYIYNRNPRNLEKLCIAYKPVGYHLEKPGREWWHKLVVKETGRQVTASVVHYSGAVAVSASTNEWALKKHLYSTTDRSAYTNLGRVLGARCLESGLYEISSPDAPTPSGKLHALLDQLEKSGLALEEPPRYVRPSPSDPQRPEQPWKIH